MSSADRHSEKETFSGYLVRNFWYVIAAVVVAAGFIFLMPPKPWQKELPLPALPVEEATPKTVISAPERRLSELQTARKSGDVWNETGNVVLGPEGILILADSMLHAKAIHISLDNNDYYRIVYLAGERETGETGITPHVLPSPGGLYVHQLTVPETASLQGFDRLWITGSEGDGRYSIGHIILTD
jgi:hypothetical protein